MTFAMTHAVKFQPQYRGTNRLMATKTFPVFRQDTFNSTSASVYPVDAAGRESPERSPGVWAGYKGADYP